MLHPDSTLVPTRGPDGATAAPQVRPWRVFYPVAVTGAMALHLLLTRDLAPQWHSLVSGIVSLGFLFLSFGIERVHPARAAWNRDAGDTLADVMRTNLVLPTATQLNVVALGGLVGWLTAHAHWARHFPVHWPLAAQLALALLVAEFCYYWLHRASHGMGALWRFHAVHHGAGRVYSLNSGRFHFVDAWLSAFFYLAPLILLGVPAPVLALLTTLNAVTGVLEHANIAFEAGPLNRILNTAQLHRWHHSSDPEIGACNFGKVLSVWDQVFGTWRPPSQAIVADVGLPSSERAVPGTFWGQAMHPWRGRRG